MIVFCNKVSVVLFWKAKVRLSLAMLGKTLALNLILE
jgi:hypothetical protein